MTITTNNDFIDLSGYYNQNNLDAYNQQAILNGDDTYGNPLAWMRADQADGTLDRAALRSRVFSDESERRWLEQLTHPLIGQEIVDQINALEPEFAALDDAGLIAKTE